MANELRITWTTGKTLYGVVFRETDDKVWYPVEAVFETAGTGGRTISDYTAVVLSETPAGFCRYVGDFPTAITTAGVYDVQVRVQGGLTPVSTDQRAGMIAHSWSGAVTIEEEEPGGTGEGGMITEIQHLTGHVGDTDLVTTARCARWLNDAQLDIIEHCVGHLDLEYKHPTAITLEDGVYSYSLASLSPALMHFLRAYYIDGANSEELDYKSTEDFDLDYPSPLDGSEGPPTKVTRRGNTIEIYPVPSASEAGKYLRVDYTKRPTAFVTTNLSAVCDMSDADAGLIYFAVSKAFKAIGGEKLSESERYYQYYLDWRDTYRETKDGLLMANLDNLFA